MAFYGQFPTTGGPNDLPPVQLTPQQYAFAFQQFQLSQQLPHLPVPSPSHLPIPVIDPSLQAPPSVDSNDRITALEREVRELKKRANSNAPEFSPSPKRRKKAKTSSAYILRDNKKLSVDQKEVRKQLMARHLLSIARTH